MLPAGFLPGDWLAHVDKHVERRVVAQKSLDRLDDFNALSDGSIEQSSPWVARQRAAEETTKMGAQCSL